MVLPAFMSRAVPLQAWWDEDGMVPCWPVPDGAGGREALAGQAEATCSILRAVLGPGPPWVCVCFLQLLEPSPTDGGFKLLTAMQF